MTLEDVERLLKAAGDFIVHGTDDKVTCIVFSTLQNLVKEKYAVI